ncbi:DNA methyltransferase [Candidatus Parvarchaeota archaeon]|nr:DNA methyltransferase [Candidatus Parvarchaeota archaeon]
MDLIINKDRFLEILEKAKETKELGTLRNIISEIILSVSTKHDDLFLLNISDNGDTVRYNKDLLLSELKQINETQTIERAKYYTERLIKSIEEIKTSKINEINLNRWKEYSDIITDSLWIWPKRDNSGVHTAGYWGNFIPQIPYQVITRYTKKGDTVLDTFLGSGTTLIECRRLGRNGIGIELNEKVAKEADSLIAKQENPYNILTKVICADSRDVSKEEILKITGGKKVQLIIMHPPYFDIIKFSKSEKDLSNAPNLTSFLTMFGEVIKNVTDLLEKDRYLILVIGDKYARGEWIPLGFLTAIEVIKNGYTLKSINVKNIENTLAKRNQEDLWRYRALVGGFNVFKHEYVMVFKKTDSKHQLVEDVLKNWKAV